MRMKDKKKMKNYQVQFCKADIVKGKYAPNRKSNN